jgi:hypothetical protein
MLQGGLAMTTKDEIEKRLQQLRLEHRKVLSMLSMMEKGTKLEDLVKMRKEQLDPIRDEITKLEGELLLLQ